MEHCSLAEGDCLNILLRHLAEAWDRIAAVCKPSPLKGMPRGRGPEPDDVGVAIPPTEGKGRRYTRNKLALLILIKQV